MGNTKTTAQSDASENQEQWIENNANPTEWAETTIKSKAMWLLLALQMAVWGSWVANAWEPPQDQTKITPPWKELVVNQNWEQKMLTDFSKLPQQDKIAPYLDKYQSLIQKDKNTVSKYYIDNPNNLPKCSFQLINLLYSIQENNKFREKFSSLIVDWKFV